jgi:hypothetical protein
MLDRDIVVHNKDLGRCRKGRGDGGEKGKRDWKGEMHLVCIGRYVSKTDVCLNVKALKDVGPISREVFMSSRARVNLAEQNNLSS